VLNTQALFVSLQLAAWTTLLVLALSIPLAGWLVLSRSRLRPFIDALITLPLVLPPTVMGFYLLLALSPTSWLGGLAARALGHPLPFSFTGLLLASVVINIPFAVRPIAAAFAAVPLNLIESAQLLGDSRARTLRKIMLPLSYPGVLAGAMLVAVHTVGEFGVALMMGGSIPGETKTLSMSLYNDVQAMEYQRAHASAAALMGISLFGLAVVSWTASRRNPRLRRS